MSGPEDELVLVSLELGILLCCDESMNSHCLLGAKVKSLQVLLNHGE